MDNNSTQDSSADRLVGSAAGISAGSSVQDASPLDASTSDGPATDGSTLNNQLKMLLERCVQGDQVAFKTLYDLSSWQLLAILRRILRIDAVAEEALQETYVKIWEKASDYKAELGQPLTWMTSIARYHALDVLRKRRIRENKEVEWDEGLPGIDFMESGPGLAQTTEYRDILEQCFGRLSPGQQTCIARAFLEGLTHKELSVSLESPVGTIKSWIRRGLASLKECVSELS